MTTIKTKQPVVIDTRKGYSEVLYFQIIAEKRDEIAEFKGQRGQYDYLVGIMVLREGKLVPAFNFYPSLIPIQATYKLTTWLTLFGDMTPNQIEADKARLMIAQFAYNSAEYWGLTAADYEVYVPEVLEEKEEK